MLAIDAVGRRHGVKVVFLVPPVHETDRRDSVVNRIFDRALALARMSPSSITARCVATQSCSKATILSHPGRGAAPPRFSRIKPGRTRPRCCAAEVFRG